MAVSLLHRLAILSLLVIGASQHALAWDTAPWDLRPFDQPAQITARQQALIGSARAAMMAKAGSLTQSFDGLITDKKTCSVNVGNVAIPARSGIQSVVNEVTVEGTIINICH